MIKWLFYQIPRDKAEGHLYSYFAPHLSHHITSSVGVKWNTNRVGDLIKWPQCCTSWSWHSSRDLVLWLNSFHSTVSHMEFKTEFTMHNLSETSFVCCDPYMTILILRTVQDINNLKIFWFKNRKQDRPRWQKFELKIQIFLF